MPIVIVCPRCRATLPDERVSLARRNASCPACGKYFAIDDQLAAPVTPPAGPRPWVRRPERFERLADAGGLVVRWRWLDGQIGGQFAFTLFIDSCLILWTDLAGRRTFTAGSLLMLLHLIVALYVTWRFLGQLLNSTSVEVDRAGLRVRIGPVPGWAGHTIPAGDIGQLFCTMRQFRGQRRRRYQTTYQLHARLADGRTVTLLRGVAQAEEVLYLEQEIERCLGIEDQPVRGELAR